MQHLYQNVNTEEMELICLASDPGERNLSILYHYPEVIILPIHQFEYSPGKVLNHAAQKARGRYLLFLNDDAIIRAPGWAEALSAPLADPKVGATFARQIARPDAFLSVFLDYERTFGDGSLSAKWENFFSIVSAGVRREVILEHPIHEGLFYAEDTEWSMRLKLAGYQLVYTPEAVIEHSHDYSLKELGRRFFREAEATIKIGKGASVLRTLFWRLPGSLLRDTIVGFRMKRSAEIPFALCFRLIQNTAYAWGIFCTRTARLEIKR